MSEKINRGLTVVLGILMIFCGITAIGTPFMLGAMMTTMIAMMLIIGGIAEMVMAFSNGWKAGFPIFLAGILTVIAGGVIFGNPLFASATFTILISVYFISEGILRSVHAVKSRPAQGWRFVLFSGIISVLLGIMLMRGWPVSGMMAIGIFAGVRLLIGGMNILSVGTLNTPSE